MQLQNSSSKPSDVATSPAEAIQTWLVDKIAENLSLDPKSIDVSESLTRYGLDSIDAVTLVGDLEDWLEAELPDTLFWDYPTIEKAAEYLVNECDVSALTTGGEAEKVEVAASSKSEEKPAKKGWFGR
jgi:acyl carrier protein